MISRVPDEEEFLEIFAKELACDYQKNFDAYGRTFKYVEENKTNFKLLGLFWLIMFAENEGLFLRVLSAITRSIGDQFTPECFEEMLDGIDQSERYCDYDRTNDFYNRCYMHGFRVPRIIA